MIKKIKYDENGNRVSGLFRIFCDDCGKRIGYFRLALEKCERCKFKSKRRDK